MNHIEPYGGKQALLIHESSHDTFDTSRNLNWLANKAGLGVYAHGRVHQDLGSIYVGDMVHKRGHLTTEDVLLQEEQALDSMGEPLSAPSRLGKLIALAMLPTMSTANGEGDLIAYYERGVVAFNTHEAPRETRFDGNGAVIQRGWDSKRLVNHLLNTVGAVGRYSVAVLTRDHFFRSVFGLHFLKTVIGEGTFNNESTNRISQDVDPILEKDEFLEGAACGQWIHGTRLFATTGLTRNDWYSTTSFGRGFVSLNQAIEFTNDRTPIPAWEGLWLMDSGMSAIHKFTTVTSNKDYGFIASDGDRHLKLGTIRKTLEEDFREKAIPIEWNLETGQFAPLSLTRRGSISEAVLELVLSESSQTVRVLIRTDVATDWKLWTTIKACDKMKKSTQRLRVMESLGRPPLSHRECTWFQIRLEGSGYASDISLDLDFSPTTTKSGRKSCAVVDDTNTDYFKAFVNL